MTGTGKSSKHEHMATNPDNALTSIGLYLFQKTVGEGNFAKVKLAKHKITGQDVAIKIIDKTSMDEKKLQKLYREIRIMKMLHHPHVIKLYEVIETKHTMFLVMEYAPGGELYDYLVVHGRMKEKEARAKFRQILGAVSYCHKKRIIHRDLKAENLLLDANLDVKVADLGFSNLFDPEGKLDTFCGSPPYAAPELFQGKRYVGPEVDVWSLGVILYVLTTGCLPFDGKNLQEMRESVCKGKYRIPFYLSEPCEKLLRKMLIRDPAKRASLDFLINDPWINEGYNSSPIVVTVHEEQVSEDPLILKIMETKLHVDKGAIVRGLKDNVYDETMAIYFLLWQEKQRNGEAGVIKIGEQLALKDYHPAPTSPEAVRPASASAKRAKEEISSASATSTPVAQRRPSSRAAPPTTGTGAAAIPENAPAPTVSRDQPSAAADAGKQRVRRRNTLAGDSDIKKLAENDPEEEAMLKKLQTLQMNGTDGGKHQQSSGQSALSASMNAGDRKRVATASSTPSTPVQLRSALRHAAPVVNTVIEEDADSHHSSNQPPATTSNTPNQASQDVSQRQPVRKRTNTITGIFRLRRSTDADKPQNVPVEEADSSSATASSIVNADPSKPRSLRFTFNSSTTSTKAPDDIVQEVTLACAKTHIKYKPISRYVIECTCAGTSAAAGNENVVFEVEICKLPRLKNLHGLKFKRVDGSSSSYKDACERLLAAIQL